MRSGHAARLRPAWAALRRRGVLVLDGAVEAGQCAALREEVRALQGAMGPNETKLVRGERVDTLRKKGILEHEVRQGGRAAAALAPTLYGLDPNAMLEPAPFLDLNGVVEVKAQLNQGSGACFPIHTDTDGRVDQRVLTGIVYLNESWKPKDGGQLRVYPFPLTPIDIAPLQGRMVLFSSVHCLHRVLPSTTPRFCFSMWWHGTAKAGNAKHPVASIQDARLRHFLAKVMLAGEWADSLQESHSASDNLHATMLDHWSSINAITQTAVGRDVPWAAQQYPVDPDELDIDLF